MESKFVSVEGCKIHYLEQVLGTGPTYVLIHGMFGEAKALGPFADSLGEGRIVALDLPGEGDSEPLYGPQYNHHGVDAFAALVDAFMAKLELKDVILIGHSYGGVVALKTVAVSRRVARLVVLNPYPQYTVNLTTLFYQVSFEIGKRLPLRLRTRMFQNRRLADWSGAMVMHTRDQALRQQLYDAGYDSRLKADILAGQQVIDDLKKFRFAPVLEQIQVPLLAIDGASDRLANIKKYINCVVNNSITYQVASDAGHLFPLEDPQRAATMVLDWINGLK